ncbi:NAD(P)-dependent alcohol dehydrogenase [Microbacteriaceae bacterium 4G12]
MNMTAHQQDRRPAELPADLPARPPVASPARTMTAVVQDEYGPADRVLRVERVPVPVPAEGEVLVRVAAAGVDRGVWHLLAGLPYPIRLAGFGLRRPRTRVRGADVAGRVEAVGPGVDAFSPGDEVFGIGAGSFAEFVLCPAAKLAARPAQLSPKQAAAVPVSGLTALQAVRDQGRVAVGHRVLVVGASGGVGSFAVQIAKAFGAHVTGVSSAGKASLVTGLGADRVIDYAAEDFSAGSERYDVIIDTGGHASLRRLRRALTRTGTLVIVGSETGGRWLGGTDRQLRAMALSPFVPQKLGTFVASENAADLRVLADLVRSGAVMPAVDRAFPLEDAPAAIGYLLAGRARGKVVLTV